VPPRRAATIAGKVVSAGAIHSPERAGKGGPRRARGPQEQIGRATWSLIAAAGAHLGPITQGGGICRPRSATALSSPGIGTAERDGKAAVERARAAPRRSTPPGLGAERSGQPNTKYLAK